MPASQAPLTRRQIREAERAREAAAAAEREAALAAERQAALAAERQAALAAESERLAAEGREREAALAAERERAAEERERELAAEREREAAAERQREAAAAERTRQTVAAADVTLAPAARDAVRQNAAEQAVAADARARDTADTEVLPVPPPPSRRALRPAPRTSAAASRAHRSWAPRAAVLGAMGALTIVAPLTGFAAPEAEPAAAAAVAPQPSVLDVLDEQAANVALAAVPASLLKDPAASSRATVLQTSRAADRDALTCAPLDGASGARAAVTERAEQYVRPLADGTYRNSSHYGNRSHPLSGAYSFHTGTDYAAPLGTPIYAIADGTVEYVGAGKDGRSSMLVILRHEVDGQTVYSWYVHMYRDGIHVTEGQQVSAGQVIAEVGNNGNSTGPHLHLEIHLDDQGTTVDPLPWLEKLGAVEVAALC
ncbi:M23 family metallopeptidase [Georgenia daeguensis]|uniref:M23 family metallopeptidase n=1 Tax=Georgenia daeguensis TaxID=908355 RepID=UPI0031E769F2